MNDILKIVLVSCFVIFLYVFNHWLFNYIFALDQSLIKNSVAWPTLFSFFFTALYIALYRIVKGKLKFEITWK